MSTRPSAERAVLFVLGLIVVLVADAFALQPHQQVRAAADADAGVSLSADSNDALVCPSGFGDTRQRGDMSLHGVAISEAGAVAVGFTRRRTEQGGQRRPAALYTTSGRWNRAFVPSPGAEDGLIAVASNGGSQAWAVGFMTTGGNVMPLAMRWNGREWNVNKPQPRGELASMLTDVTIVGHGDPFVVGYRMTANGKRKPLAARRDGKRWRYLSPRAGRRESITLTGVSLDRGGGLWAVGHGGRGAVVGPVIYHRDNGSWKRMKTPKVRGEAVLTDVVAAAANDAWAVGYQRNNGRSRPLVLHWDGKRWQRTQAPRFETDETLLTAVSAPSSGGIWVVGSGWNHELNNNEALAAWWDGLAWNTVAGPEGGDELHDVAGSLHDGGWAVGRAGKDARATRVCVRSQASIFGGSEPLPPAQPPTANVTPVRDDANVAGSSDEGDSRTAATPDDDTDEVVAEVGEAVAAATLIANKKKNKKKARRIRRKRRAAAQTLPVARADARVSARNMASKAGLAGNINSYGGVAADFDGDGDQDLYIGAHGRPGRLVLNDNGKFTDHEPMAFPAIDRHGCAASDIDGSGLPDLYCTVGGRRGSGLKANELWIDPGGPAPVDIAVEAGVADPTGRGRETVFLSSGKGNPLDLVVTNSPTRVDGLPSLGRLYRSNGEGEFSTRARTGFAPRLGALSVQDADFNGDGRDDLLLVTGGPQAPRAQGTRLYRNTKQGLLDVTVQSGIRSFGEIDAALVDLNRDEHLDLVQLSPTRLKVSIWHKGRFRKVYQRSLTYGRSLAFGDVNGDKRDDLYIVRSNGIRNPIDVMLVNRKNGRSFSSMSIPQTLVGDGDRAIAIDHDDNGLTDFLVLNGRSERGPTQLIAFYRRAAASIR